MSKTQRRLGKSLRTMQPEADRASNTTLNETFSKCEQEPLIEAQLLL
jgi:hypothetical protein